MSVVQFFASVLYVLGHSDVDVWFQKGLSLCIVGGCGFGMLCAVLILRSLFQWSVYLCMYELFGIAFIW